MTNYTGGAFASINKYRISRRGKKLQACDDQRTLLSLPKEVPERTWAEVLQKEENDLFIFEIREDIFDGAMKEVYEKYMEKQNALFTAHCAAEAWLQLIDWHFYRHDPGEDPSAYPPCYIPKRLESWIPDELPDPSPKDTWCRQELNVIEDTPDEILQKCPSSTSLDVPVVEAIPSEYWFPGKINVPQEMRRKVKDLGSMGDERHRRPSVLSSSQQMSGMSDSRRSSDSSRSREMAGAESELIQKVTDYSTEELSMKESGFSALKTTTPVDGSLHGAGDSMVRPKKSERRHSTKSKVFSKASLQMQGKSKGRLPPLDRDSRSHISIISDCRLRNLRLETQYEIASEKIDTPPNEPMRRK